MAKHRTVDSFLVAVQDFVEKKAPEAAEKSIRKVVLAGYGMLIEQSPVRAGTFRANWYPAVNQIPATYNPNKKSATPIQMPAFKIGDTIVHGNNSPYAKRLESGWSKQAPQGIVGVVKRKLELALRGKKL